MQNKTLLVLFSVYLIGCITLAVSAFSFSSSEKNVVKAQEIVKREGDSDNRDHEHGHGDEDDDGHGHHSASFILHGKTYAIPCGEQPVNIDDICNEGMHEKRDATIVATIGTGSTAVKSTITCTGACETMIR